ncbi:MAG: hypothetical protein LUQ37_10000 [Methanoregulaceae archaeon]|jgi:hypothetical protein|nr:hypothetical protein [Methanoregulaceae archaeon]
METKTTLIKKVLMMVNEGAEGYRAEFPVIGYVDAPRFETGKVFYTNGAVAAHDVSMSTRNRSVILECLTRHFSKDWGDLCPEDKRRNDSDLETGEGHVISRYNTREGDFYVETEWDGSYTTVMLVEER